MYASPFIWVPLSLCVALFYAIGNNITSLISHFGFKARAIQAPGSTASNFLALLMISIYDRHNGWFNWWKVIYLKPIPLSEQSDSDNDTKFKGILWERVILTVVIACLSTFSYWMFTLSYYYATLANLNNGVIMAVYSLKPLISSVAFYFLFAQSLKKFEILGIFFSIISILCIALSTGKFYE